MSEIKISLSEILKDRNMAQSELVRFTGIRSETISNLVRNKTERVTLSHLAKIMTALELDDISKLLSYIPDEVPEDKDDECIEMLGLPAAVYFPLKRNYYQKIDTIKDLLKADLKKVPGIGPKHRETIRLALEEYRS
ncbi:hypothetical protein CSV80_00750 [Sporosarcina sp. P12(2017)]|uniref:helix-turn-helix domain-containing protein n=1 Tax=unclassified Sporosarcina TaxID=2647733 RepID=UPI000C1629DC|nr:MULTISPECIES: helix-turn-helix transcriptional regulator [unclassified Sporosarcina]PIC59084.1 hypothetical protein CSV81_00750 [Sporosarcina sp. P10]PIC62405.1 hypothetical protein CSV80_00750 [Sporosarcina sp. P12(2017)]